MTLPVRTCTTCAAPLPVGAVYCRVCGASAPTEVGRTPAPSDTPSSNGDHASRKREVQLALGSGFEVKELIGRGGFGEVWSAQDLQLQRAVAVKVLRPELSASLEFRERFRREARAVAQLRHPNIVPIYHVGESRGLVFFVMPLIQGTTLTAALRTGGGMAANEAVRIMLEAASALREAHNHGIVHRDLKPENFMLEGPQRRVLLMDFGVAKVEGPSKEGLTETGVVLGSPEYMSPEQATGKALDARSDIYSLGVVGYRMLAGKLPFMADTAREVLAHHVLSPPEPLSRFVDAPPALADAVMRCLAKNPDERWQSTDDLVSAISSAGPMISQPLPTREEIPVVRAARSPRRRGLLVASAALLTVLVVLAIIGPQLRERWRAGHSWVVASQDIVRLYREAGDSLRAAAGAYARGTLTGPQYLAVQESLALATDARIDEAWGGALDDSVAWPDAPRRAIQSAAATWTGAGLDASHHALAPSDIANCRMQLAGDSTMLKDDVPDDNCWWQATATAPLASPVEYFADFRVGALLGDEAGLGLSWCTRPADCRVVFLWANDAVEWASHLPQTGLRAIALGRRAPLGAGAHRLRVRERDGTITVWLDERQVFEGNIALDVAYLERPSSVHVVVQNATVFLARVEPLGVVGVRRPGF